MTNPSKIQKLLQDQFEAGETMPNRGLIIIYSDKKLTLSIWTY